MSTARKRSRGLTERQVRALSKRIIAHRDANEAAIKLRMSDLHRLIGTTDHELIEMRAKAEAFLTAAMMVLEALNP